MYETTMNDINIVKLIANKNIKFELSFKFILLKLKILNNNKPMPNKNNNPNDLRKPKKTIF